VNVTLELSEFSSLSLAEARNQIKFCNSYTRLPALIDLAMSVEFDDWLTLVGENWQDCDNIAQHIDKLCDLTPFGDVADQPSRSRHLLMNVRERGLLDALPESVIVYRGCYHGNKWGWCWTLDRCVAEKFPSLHRYKQDGQALLVKAKIQRDKIIAYKGDREEQEIICYRPAHISTSHIKTF